MNEKMMVELWADFEKALLFDFPLTSRERHLAAACFWLGLKSAFELTTTCSPEVREIFAKQAHGLGVRALACVGPRPPVNDQDVEGR
jgi:hypothetical protein